VLQRFRYVTIPQLRGILVTLTMFDFVGAFVFFDLVWIMTKGGPVNASEVMATYMYRYSFVRFELGYGSAVSIVMFLICLTISLIYQRVAPHRDYLG